MSDVVHKVYCLIFKDENPFTVNIPAYINIDNLRPEIKELCKNSSLHDVDTKDLIIWKVSTPRPSAAPQN